MEEISPTKTALDEGNIIVWSEDDKISVLSHSGAEKKHLIDNESVGNSQGSFHPVDPIDSSDEKKAITAVY